MVMTRKPAISTLEFIHTRAPNFFQEPRPLSGRLGLTIEGLRRTRLAPDWYGRSRRLLGGRSLTERGSSTADSSPYIEWCYLNKPLNPRITQPGNHEPCAPSPRLRSGKPFWVTTNSSQRVPRCSRVPTTRLSETQYADSASCYSKTALAVSKQENSELPTEFFSPANPKLRKNAVEMTLNRALRNRQGTSNFLVPQSLGDKIDDFFFTTG